MYFNDVSILARLKQNAPQALYHGIFRQPELGGSCKGTSTVPVTFPFRQSKVTVSTSQVEGNNENEAMHVDHE